MAVPNNFVELLRQRAAEQPDDPAVIILEDGERETVYSYADLDRRSRAFAACMLERLRPGDRVALLQPFGIDFVASFFGCLYANLISAPMYPPRNPKHMTRLQAVLEDAGARAMATAEKSRQKIRQWLGEEAESFQMFCNEEISLEQAENWRPPTIRPDVTAYLQYTSGSTASPKGVMISHANVMANLEQLRHKMGLTETSVFVSWLPIFHDMGLVSSLMIALYIGSHIVMMAPSSFAQKPFRWLNAISKYRGQATGAPNFAFELCSRKITEEQKAELDLRCLDVAYCGSEPIHFAVLERFAKAFAPCGFRHEALYAIYGLAEATGIVSGGIRGAGPVYCKVDPAAIQQHRAIPLPPDDPKGLQLTSCGQSPRNQQLAIVEPETRRRLAEGEIGEIWVAGPHVALGYWEKPRDTEETFRAFLASGEGPFLRTGDLGFQLHGELYFTGRIKELIIIHGRNFYPQDIEHVVAESHPALSATDGAAFAIDTPSGERLVIVHEVQRVERRQLEPDEVISAIRQALFSDLELAPCAVVLLQPAALPKTSSGKIQRGVARQKFLAGSLVVLAEWRESFLTEEELPEARPVEETADEERRRRTREILDWITRWGEEHLGTRSFAVDPGKKLAELGLDSIAAVEFAGDLSDYLNRSLPPNIVYEFETVGDMMDFLLRDGEPEA